MRSLMKIVRVALGLCMERDGSRIESEDLAEATDRFAVAGGLIDRNPFASEASQ